MCVGTGYSMRRTPGAERVNSTWQCLTFLRSVNIIQRAAHSGQKSPVIVRPVSEATASNAANANARRPKHRPPTTTAVLWVQLWKRSMAAVAAAGSSHAKSLPLCKQTQPFRPSEHRRTAGTRILYSRHILSLPKQCRCRVMWLPKHCVASALGPGGGGAWHVAP